MIHVHVYKVVAQAEVNIEAGSNLVALNVAKARIPELTFAPADCNHVMIIPTPPASNSGAPTQLPSDGGMNLSGPGPIAPLKIAAPEEAQVDDAAAVPAEPPAAE